MASRRRVWAATLLLGFVVSCGASSNEAAQGSAQAGATLYKRLGGFDAIAAVVDDFVPRLVADPQLGRFFLGHSNDSKGRLRQLVVELVCQATGGPCLYAGRPMKTAHAGLGITEADWQSAMTHFGATLDKFKLARKEKDELVAILTGLKNDIVEKK
jgi:hemoglobin